MGATLKNPTRESLPHQETRAGAAMREGWYSADTSLDRSVLLLLGSHGGLGLPQVRGRLQSDNNGPHRALRACVHPSFAVGDGARPVIKRPAQRDGNLGDGSYCQGKGVLRVDASIWSGGTEQRSAAAGTASFISSLLTIPLGGLWRTRRRGETQGTEKTSTGLEQVEPSPLGTKTPQSLRQETPAWRFACMYKYILGEPSPPTDLTLTE